MRPDVQKQARNRVPRREKLKVSCGLPTVFPSISAASAAATTTATAAAAITTAATTGAGALLARTRFVDRQGPTVQIFAIQGAARRIRSFLGFHGHESEAARAAAKTVHDEI